MKKRAAPGSAADKTDKSDNLFCSWFNSTQATSPPDLVRIFERKENTYTVHGDYAKYIAQEYFHTLACVTALGSGNLPTVELKKDKFEEVLKSLLLVKYKRVELLSKKGLNWEVIRKASPGNVQHFQELLWTATSAGEPAISVAVCFGLQDQQKVVGFAFADTALQTMGVSQFIDNVHLSNLEAALIQVGAKECLVAESARDEIEVRKLVALLNKCGIMHTPVKRNKFKVDNLMQDLSRLLTEENISNNPVLEMKHAQGALACVISYLDLMSDPGNHSEYRLDSWDISKYMRLDRPAVRALNLLPEASDANKNFNLYGLLNKCRTAMGSRRLMQFIKQPLLDIKIIEHRLDMVELFLKDTELRSTFVDLIKAMPDLARLTKKFQKKKLTATLKDCVILYDVAKKLPEIYECLAKYDGVHSELLQSKYVKALGEIVDDLSPFGALIEGTIDLDAADNHEYIIRPEFDATWAKLTNTRDKLKKAIDGVEIQAKKELEGGGKKIMGGRTTNIAMAYAKNGFGWTIQCPKSYLAKIKKLAGYSVVEEGAKLKVTTRDLSKLNKEYEKNDQELTEKQQALVTEVLETVASYAPVFENIGELIGELDVYACFAHVSTMAPRPYCRPKLTEAGTGDIILIEARHPCLEVQDGVDFIPNDVVLKRGVSEFQIITGPNMGGKSTYIRSAGTIVLMAQIGCYVPCASATVSITDCILSRIGASDSQLRGVSTFMAEMQETASILKAATNQSLIIIDELGRGTSTYDGFGLAWAISEYICKNIGCFCFFATHFHELTALASHIPTATNYHVTAETRDSKLVLLYHLEQGPSDKSFGIDIAELAGFPNTVVEVARRKVGELEQSSSSEIAVGVTGQKRSAREMESTDKKKAQAAVKMNPKEKEATATKRPKVAPAGPEVEGKKLVLSFLDQFGKMPLDNLPPKEAIQRLQELKERLLRQNNPYIASLLRNK